MPPWEPSQEWVLDLDEPREAMQELLENEENLAVAHIDDETEEIIIRSTKASGEKSHIVALSKSVGGVKAEFQHSSTPRTRRARTILQGDKLYEKD